MAVLSLDAPRAMAGRFERVRHALLTGGLQPCAVPPLWLAAGVTLYFQAPLALSPALIVALIVAGLAGRWAAARFLWRAAPRWAVAALAWAALGYGAAGWRTWSADAPVIEDSNRGWTVEGWVTRLDPGERPAVTIAVSEIDGLPPEETPRHVRARITGDTPSLGQGVRGRLGLSPPPGPSAPGDYDFSRGAYFDRLGGTGFSYGALEPAEVTAAGRERVARGLARIRGMLADRIRERVPDNRGGVLAALVTGDRSGIAPADTEALRESGLAHLLAISGLHMVLVGGGVFAVVTLLLALIEPLSRGRDVRKPAAIFALIAATVYLLISGAPISAQRAWIMLSVMLVAALFDRRALTLRNVAVAAVIVLLISPDSLFEAGFQMSFAATAALIAAYEALRAYRPEGPRERSLWASGWRFFGALTFTSLVAGAATGGFAAFHFNRMATYGMAGNLGAMPVFTLLVMPATTIGAALVPLGLDGPFLKVAAWGVGLILRSAEMVSAQSGAVTPTPAGPAAALGVYALGFTLVCFGRGLVRAGGLATMGLAAIIWAAAPRPILWVSDSAVVAGAAGQTLYASDLRRSRYGVERFAQRLGMGDDAAPRHFREIAGCDSEGCIGWLGGVRLATPASRAALVEDCADADLVAFGGAASARLRRTCGAILLDAGVLRDHGPAIIMRARDGTLTVRHAEETAWRSPYQHDEDAERF